MLSVATARSAVTQRKSVLCARLLNSPATDRCLITLLCFVRPVVNNFVLLLRQWAMHSLTEAAFCRSAC
jgi:hypothetical protein